MTKTGATFAYWNTKADGTGTFHGWPQDTSVPDAGCQLDALRAVVRDDGPHQRRCDDALRVLV